MYTYIGLRHFKFMCLFGKTDLYIRCCTYSDNNLGDGRNLKNMKFALLQVVANPPSI